MKDIPQRGWRSGGTWVLRAVWLQMILLPIATAVMALIGQDYVVTSVCLVLFAVGVLANYQARPMFLRSMDSQSVQLAGAFGHKEVAFSAIRYVIRARPKDYGIPFDTYWVMQSERGRHAEGLHCVELMIHIPTKPLPLI